MEIATLAGLTALAWKMTSMLKFLIARDTKAAMTQAVVWAAGIGVILLGAQADLTEHVNVANNLLGDLDVWSQILLGLSIGSGASVGYDVKAALDNSDSAREPSLGETGPRPAA